MRRLTGDYPAAAATAEQALTLHQQLGHRPGGEAETLNHIGQLLLDSATPTAAHQQFTAALNIAQHINTPTHHARALEGIGQCLLHQGHHHDGIQHLHDALAIYQRINSPHATRVQTTLHRQDRQLRGRPAAQPNARPDHDGQD
jgi:Tfp pilus assembly protein PilF